MALSLWYPRLTGTECEKLREAYVKLDQIGQAIGVTNLGAKPVILGNLAEVSLLIAQIVMRADRYIHDAKERRGLLTAEEIAADEAAKRGPGAEEPIAEGE